MCFLLYVLCSLIFRQIVQVSESCSVGHLQLRKSLGNAGIAKKYLHFSHQLLIEIVEISQLNLKIYPFSDQ